jgi:tRNA-binding EMAP/Myf-like protein
MTGQGRFIPATIKPTISQADFDRLDVRVGTIERVEDVPKPRTLI